MEGIVAEARYLFCCDEVPVDFDNLCLSSELESVVNYIQPDGSMFQ